MTHFSRSSERGASLIELSIALPIFFLLLFGIVDFGRVSLGFGTVRAATAIAVRRAAGPERPPWQVFVALGGPAVQLSTLRGLPEFQSPVNGPWYTAPAVSTLDEMESRAIAFANSILRESIGKVSFPCRDAANCVECFTTRGQGELHDGLFWFRGSRSDVERAQTLGLECRYDVPVITSAFGFGLLRGFVTVRSRSYFPVEGYDSPIL